MIKELGSGKEALVQIFLNKCFESGQHRKALWVIEKIMDIGEDKELALENLAYQAFRAADYKICLSAIKAMQPGQRKNKLLEIMGNKTFESTDGKEPLEKVIKVDRGAELKSSKEDSLITRISRLFFGS